MGTEVRIRESLVCRCVTHAIDGVGLTCGLHGLLVCLIEVEAVDKIAAESAVLSFAELVVLQRRGVLRVSCFFISPRPRGS